MTITIIVGIAWVVLFGLLQWAMKHDAEHAPAFAHPIDGVRTFEEATRESPEPQSARRVG
jgi:hypothetical protein